MADKIKEKSLWSWLKTAKKLYKADLDMHRVENGVGASFPDVEGYHKKYGPFVIELKTCPWPKRITTAIRPKFEKGQPEWLYRRWLAGGSAWVLIHIGRESSSARFLIPGGYAMELNRGVDREFLHLFGIEVSRVEEVFEFIGRIQSRRIKKFMA